MHKCKKCEFDMDLDRLLAFFLYKDVFNLNNPMFDIMGLTFVSKVLHYLHSAIYSESQEFMNMNV